MKLKVYLSIGFVGANREDEIKIDDEDLEGLTPEQREECLWQIAQEWANNYIEIWHKEDE